ncbi:MAG TPA: alpha/beta fold hydrolase, partial [Gemmatimonadaceae bacterium]|nr:alpha/beta fold hydrolase [Gemmatimonadaceae bacterium]
TDRDGNNPMLPGKNNSLRYLAEALAERGIASLRYDKRGIAGSGMQGLPTDLRFEHYVDDAVAWGKKLQADPRFSSVTVVGHSEGSLIGMLATPRIPAAKVVSIAGLGFTAPEGILRQVRAALPTDQVAQVEAALNRVARGEDPGEYPPALAPLFHPNALPYLRSWFPYDPRVAATGVGAPLLVVQGLHDFQALEEDARAIAAANPRAMLRLIPGMNHVLKQSPLGRMEQVPVYSDSTIAIDHTLIDVIATFVRSP